MIDLVRNIFKNKLIGLIALSFAALVELIYAIVVISNNFAFANLVYYIFYLALFALAIFSLLKGKNITLIIACSIIFFNVAAGSYSSAGRYVDFYTDYLNGGEIVFFVIVALAGFLMMAGIAAYILKLLNVAPEIMDTINLGGCLIGAALDFIAFIVGLIVGIYSTDAYWLAEIFLAISIAIGTLSSVSYSEDL